MIETLSRGHLELFSSSLHVHNHSIRLPGILYSHLLNIDWAPTMCCVKYTDLVLSP